MDGGMGLGTPTDAQVVGLPVLEPETKASILYVCSWAYVRGYSWLCAGSKEVEATAGGTWD